VKQLWLEICENFLHSPILQSVAFGTVLSAMRVVYDEKETKTKRMVLEVGIVGCISFGSGKLVSAAGLNTDLCFVVAGVLAVLGLEQIRALGQYAIKSKITQITGARDNDNDQA
jgi:hypothetical protein